MRTSNYIQKMNSNLRSKNDKSLIEKNNQVGFSVDETKSNKQELKGKR